MFSFTFEQSFMYYLKNIAKALFGYHYYNT